MASHIPYRTIWPSPIGLSASFNTELLEKAASTIADEAEALGFHQAFAPVLDLSRELRWGTSTLGAILLSADAYQVVSRRTSAKTPT